MKPLGALFGSALVLALALTGCAKTPPYPSAATPAPVPSASSATPTPQQTPSSTPSQSQQAAAIILDGTGLAGVRFGSAEAQVLSTLKSQLGTPDEAIQGQSCDKIPDSPWAQTVLYGDVWVRFDAKDTKKTSPRMLAAWGYQLGKPLPSEFTIVDDVPLDLTFNQLKAKYPAARYLDFGLPEDTKVLQLPNKLMFMGQRQPEVVWAGEFQNCPD
ncbi:MAG: hypothetical protein CVT62_13500 [Actinobacteria bacterium HGW-Actinobacteria-2]|nr:MAG: hypothetical protein CVT62_13500 [Actinobacteria bacterium HGW-Actinobacteria-2]